MFDTFKKTSFFTMSNAFINGADDIVKNEKGEFVAKTELVYKGTPMFKIGHRNISQTKCPGFYPIEEDNLYVVDGAGFNDVILKNEVPNQTAIQYLLKNCTNFKLFVVIDAGQLHINRGAVFIEILTTIMRKLTKEAMKKENLEKFI